jgi:hypothetical protein
LQYWEYEFPLPGTGEKKINLFPFYFTFFWTSAVETEPISVDLQHFIFNFDKEEIEDGKKMDAEPTEIFADFPLIEHWGGFLDYHFKLLGLNFAGTLQIVL